MPVYEYECTKCGHHVEIWQKMSDSPLKACETCNGKLKKIISQSSFHLKGSGWYVTDYASRNRTSEAKKDASSVDSVSSTSKPKEGSGDKSTNAGSTSADKAGD